MLNMILAASAAFLVGVSKGGLKGIGTVMVALMAIAFGAKASTGIMLPLLMLGDVLAVVYYNKHCKWKYLLKFLPAMIIGILIAVWVGKDLPEILFKKWMGIIILLSVIILWWRDRSDKQAIPNNILFAGSLGVIAGFTTMMGNLAGAFTNMFFLASKLPKNQFIGTAAWLYLISNWIKLPFHVFIWETINIQSLKDNLWQAALVVLGFWIGVKIVNKINEQFFRKFILIVTAIGALLIFMK